MKILHCITGLDVGGAETMLYRLATRMDMVRFQSRVVSLIDPGPMGKQLVDAGIRVDSLGMTRGVPSLSGLMKLVRIIRSWRPDVVQTWLYHADLAGLIASRLAFPLGGGPKVAWNIRCSFMALDEYRTLTGTTLKVCSALSRFPDVVLSNSEEARRFHRQIGYKPKSFEVIPNGFDTNRFRPDSEARRDVRNEFSIALDAPVIGHVARFDVMKDHRTFVSALAKVAELVPDSVFMLVGRGVDSGNARLVSWFDEAGIASNRFRLLGERQDSERVMAAMDVHVSSSIGESFPNVVGESMGCGVPNVVTDVGDSSLVVGDTGEIVVPQNALVLGDAIGVLWQKRLENMKKTSDDARNRVVERFSLPRMVASFSELYQGLQIEVL
ncbi:MAG: glycosyltransferase [Pseudodesulfovibrio sp.]|nr:glycosyltransferase [Pseudodesulfovibrio sp.]